MITKHGKVVVTEAGILIEDFHFDGSDGSDEGTPSLEATWWAISRLIGQRGYAWPAGGGILRRAVRWMLEFFVLTALSLPGEAEQGHEDGAA